MRNDDAGTSKICRPCGSSIGVGVGSLRQLNAQQNGHPLPAMGLM
jgi:hypothetical protein